MRPLLHGSDPVCWMSVAFELSVCEPESSVAFPSCQLLMERHCLLYSSDIAIKISIQYNLLRYTNQRPPPRLGTQKRALQNCSFKN